MLLRHATPVRNLKSIKRLGLLTAKALGKTRAVWCHTAGKSGWAVCHTVERHHVAAEKTVILEVRVPRTWLKKSGKTGLWYSKVDITPDRIVRVIPFEEVATSPVAG